MTSSCRFGGFGEEGLIGGELPRGGAAGPFVTHLVNGDGRDADIEPGCPVVQALAELSWASSCDTDRRI
jgi:hypothetical protein